MKTIARLLAAIAVSACLQACENPAKVPADVTIKAAEQALGAVKDEAARLVPDQLKAVQDALAAAKARFTAGEYKEALAAANELSDKVKELAAAAAAKKIELTSAFTNVDGFLSGAVKAIEARMAELGAMKKLPKEVAADALPKAKEGLAALGAAWQQARASFQSGALAEAAAQASGLPEKAQELKGLLGMEDGAAPAAR